MANRKPKRDYRRIAARTGTAPPGVILCDTEGKWGYRTQAIADDVVRNLKAKESVGQLVRVDGHAPDHSYRCAFCQHWHITSSTGRPRMSNPRRSRRDRDRS